MGTPLQLVQLLTHQRNIKPDALSRQFFQEETSKSPEFILPPSCVVAAVNCEIESLVKKAKPDSGNVLDQVQRLFTVSVVCIEFKCGLAYFGLMEGTQKKLQTHQQPKRNLYWISCSYSNICKYCGIQMSLCIFICS